MVAVFSCQGVFSLSCLIFLKTTNSGRIREIGVTGVPTYVINDRYAVVGAQPYEAFKNALAQILKKE